MKKTLLSLLSVVLVVAMAIGGTLAYLSVEGQNKSNVFTSGSIAIQLDEEVDVITNGGDGGKYSTVGEDGAVFYELMPGDYIKKEVTVSNTGENDAYVRVVVKLNNADLINNAIDEVYENDPYNYDAAEIQELYDDIFDGWGMNYTKDTDGDGNNDTSLRLTVTGDDMPEYALQVDSVKTIDEYTIVHSGNWNETSSCVIKNGKFSGYYSSNMEKYELLYAYYIELPAGEDTTLFNGIQIPADFTAAQMEMFEGLEINVYADAIQTANMESTTYSLRGETDPFAAAKAGFAELEAIHPLADLMKNIKDITTVDSADALVKYIKEGKSVVLIDDVVLNDAPLSISNDTIINLNGHTLSGKSTADTTSNLIKVAAGATLTLQNGTVSFYATTPDTEWGGEGQPAYPGYANNTISCSGTLIIDGATVENLTAKGGASYAIDANPGANLIVEDGVIDGCGKVAIRMFANSDKVATNVTINGGTITGTRAVWVHIPGSNPASKKIANLTVNGGKLISTDDEWNQVIYSYSYGDSFTKTNVALKGGTFAGDVAFGGGYKGDKENVTIGENCTFYGNVYRYLADGSTEDIFSDNTKASVNNAVALKDAVSNSSTVTEIYLVDGEYTLPSLANKEGLTIIGGEDTVIGGEDATTGFANNFGKDTTIKNVTFSGASNGVRWSYAEGGDTVFENCTFAGDSVYGFHIDSSNGATFTFNNCTFSGFNAFAGDLEKVVFNNCTFLHNGNYGHTNIWSVGYFNNCTWGEGTSYGPRGNGKIYINGIREIEDDTSLKDALASGDDVVLTDDIATSTTASGYGQADIQVNGGVLDGNGKTLSVDGTGDYTAINTTGGTIKNLAIDDGFRGIFLENITEDVYIDNAKLGGAGVCYCINTGVNDGKYSLIVTNSVLNGWTSFAQLKSASFTNCEFGQGGYYSDESGRLLKPYTNTLVEDSSFISGYYLDLSSLEAGCKVTFKSCTVNGVALTMSDLTASHDWRDYSASNTMFVELPAGRTLADCVVFQ